MRTRDEHLRSLSDSIGSAISKVGALSEAESVTSVSLLLLDIAASLASLAEVAERNLADRLIWEGRE